MPRAFRENSNKVKKHTFIAIAKYLKGLGIIFVMVFIILLIGLMILRINYAVMLALLIAFLDIMPLVGTGIVFWPWGIFEILSGNLPLGIGLILLSFIVMFARQSAEPKIMSKSLGLHPLITVTSAYAGLKIFGPFGVVALPIFVLVVYSLYNSDVFKEEKNKTPAYE